MDMISVTNGSILFGAAICMGLGAIGSAIGIGYSGAKACEAMSRQPDEQANIMRIMLIGQAQASSPSIFSLIVALVMLYMRPSEMNLATIGAYLGAAIAMGLGALGTGIGIGVVNGYAVESCGRNPRMQGILLRTMLMGASVAESTSIYALVVALCLIFLS
ncbi:MAG: ATP synthase F0 subunit C [Candidatus Wallbacteria bacterium HGW-Wallbacteria-1]|jgi:ATP synthase F0 subunit c|uniref:ATP synthase subunit c n=1 Tax=Candidatus Wallbacteria bacterium HGW-Wallbacteria-1 TaxID=2013854 RepID=A0A2N1PSJ0_9BACT|nr:MAG: ATP synthase F0 subunit C [Candidatus Wallbacteria bacterium HGW-Wallbacteria-1]